MAVDASITFLHSSRSAPLAAYSLSTSPLWLSVTVKYHGYWSWIGTATAASESDIVPFGLSCAASSSEW